MDSQQFLSLLANNTGRNEQIPVTLTVELAQELLNRYTTSRRPLRERDVEMYVRRLRHPDPEDTFLGEISIDPAGVVIAGQHILHAVIRSGIQAKVWIILNVPPPNFMRED